MPQAEQSCGEPDQSCCSVPGAGPDGLGGLTKGPGPWPGWRDPKVGWGGGGGNEGIGREKKALRTLSKLQTQSNLAKMEKISVFSKFC